LAPPLIDAMLAGMKRLIPTGRAFAWPVCFWVLLACAVVRAAAGEIALRRDVPTLDRWMYPFNFADLGPGTESYAPTFGSFDPRFDTRDGQFLLGWDTGNDVPTGHAAARYLVKRVRVTVMNGADGTFQYDPTPDDYRTYLTNSPVYIPDADLGRPIDLVGMGFRNGFTAETFLEKTFFGKIGGYHDSNIAIGTRNAFAAIFDTNGLLADISNNVGQTNPTVNYPPFEFTPWATGVATAVSPGEVVPEGVDFVFDVDLRDPLVAGYFQSALREGRLRLAVTSLHPSAQSGFTGGLGAYPRWYTKESLLGTPARLEIDVTLVGDEDKDNDGLPDDWERFYFGDTTQGANDDPDGDGVSNLSEYRAGTDPKVKSSVLSVTAYRREDGAAVLRFPVAPSQSIVVEQSADLNQWTPATGRLVYRAGGVAEWIEQDPTVPPGIPPQRFHRVRVTL